MDNDTVINGLPFEDKFFPLNDSFIWDNETSHGVIVNYYSSKYSFFLIGLTFLGGFLAGFLLQCLYAFILKTCLPEEEGIHDFYSGGAHNSAYVDDESRPPPNDHPPDYDTVMSGTSSSDFGRSRQRIQKILWRFLKVKTESDNSALELEEPPPSYSSVVINLQADLNENQ